MESYFGSDQKRIRHAKKVTEYAEQILAKEGGDPDIVIAAAVLHDIGIHAAEKKHGSPAGKYQEIEGPPIAEGILRKLNTPPEIIREVCEIVAHHHTPDIITSLNFKILWDSDWLVNIADEVDLKDRGKLSRMIEKVFKTKTGEILAKKIYLREGM
jgi:putative nucleotidyltransferase with HDIG domain